MFGEDQNHQLIFARNPMVSDFASVVNRLGAGVYLGAALPRVLRRILVMTCLECIQHQFDGAAKEPAERGSPSRTSRGLDSLPLFHVELSFPLPWLPPATLGA